MEKENLTEEQKLKLNELSSVEDNEPDEVEEEVTVIDIPTTGLNNLIRRFSKKTLNSTIGLVILAILLWIIPVTLLGFGNTVSTEESEFPSDTSITLDTTCTEVTIPTTSDTVVTTHGTSSLTSAPSTSISITSTSTETSTAETTTSITPVIITEEIPVVVEDTPVDTPTPTPPEPVKTPEPKPVVQVEPYLVYKPSTHYIHRNTCRYNSNDAYRIDTCEGLTARLCNECSPEASGFELYEEPHYVYSDFVTDREYELLMKITASEYGGMPDVYERAKITASVMNQVSYYGSIEVALDNTCAPWGFNKYSEWFCSDTVYYKDMQDAVDYYFENKDTVFAGWTANSWNGNGHYNTFRKAY